MRMGRNTYIVIIISFMTLAGLVLPAASAWALSLDPVLIEAAAMPGEYIEETYTVINDRSETIYVDVSAIPWRYDAENMVDPATWLSFEPAFLTIGPNETGKVTIRAKAIETEAGELRAMVYFDETPASMSAGAAGMKQRLGSAIYLGVLGTMVAGIDATAIEMKTHSDTIVVGRISYENPGNVHVRPRIRVTLEDEKGNTHTADVNYGPVVFPGITKEVVFRMLDTSLDDGLYSLRLDSNFYGEHVDTEHFRVQLNDGEFTVIPLEKRQE